MMWFSRGKSDHLGWFYSDGSIRSNLDLGSFFEMQIPMLEAENQESIVDLHTAYTARREINEKLKIKDICPVLIKGATEEG